MKHKRAKSAIVFGTQKKTNVAKMNEDNGAISDHSFDKALGNTINQQVFKKMDGQTSAQTASNSNGRSVFD